ncbi:MAG TPA: hypothetical protein VM370_02810 [Candidatus Thermoplasmatota archaeon]|nr:hypothetical protein [Candidatus Thermoplasmatota archaeon]
MVVACGEASVQPTHAPAGSRGGWWRYLECAHAHEVLAEWRAAEGVLLLRETAPGAPDARLESALRIAAPWEARVALWQLEARLAALGAYWRQRSSDGAGWRALLRPAGAPEPDMRRNMVIDATLAPLVHHFHDELGRGDHLLAALRSPGERFVVIRAQIDVPGLDVGRIDVLHPRLPERMAKSVVMREQLALMEQGLAKVTTRSDYLRAFGDGGDHRAQRVMDAVRARVREGDLARPERSHEAKEEYAEFLILINDPRLRALHKRFLTAKEESELLTQGAAAIAKAIAYKRAFVDHTAQHLLTLLEASLLARERLRTGKLAREDPEVRNLTHLAYYL